MSVLVLLRAPYSNFLQEISWNYTMNNIYYSLIIDNELSHMLRPKETSHEVAKCFLYTGIQGEDTFVSWSQTMRQNHQ